MLSPQEKQQLSSMSQDEWMKELLIKRGQWYVDGKSLWGSKEVDFQQPDFDQICRERTHVETHISGYVASIQGALAGDAETAVSSVSNNTAHRSLIDVSGQNALKCAQGSHLIPLLGSCLIKPSFDKQVPKLTQPTAPATTA